MKLIFDINGGDNREEIIKGALDASNEFNTDIILVGEKNYAEEILSRLDYNENKIQIIDAPDNIENNEDPAFAIRKKKNSSIVVALNLLKENKDCAFISAGSTGALLAGGLFIVGRIKGIKRGVLPVLLPGVNSKTMLIDSGANMDTDPELLMQFAELGKIFLESHYQINDPKIGLLNVGSEEGKGNNLAKETYKLLKESKLNFYGNIEARDITDNECDLVICDGFDGNILLKSIEGIVGFLVNIIFSEVEKSKFDDDLKLKLINMIKLQLKNLDSEEVGGTILLGIDGNIIKAHGSSNSLAIKNAAKYALDVGKNDVINKIKLRIGDE
ncbi:glycerol-3-phosphate acyltransferase PlsX [Peptoniphilus olsenii]|uniref:Phosphate acyltransferase n=1 Tax=Peptoniphilus olsenii TaxID=411570 RepID=A0ABV2J6X3_9FIRM